MNAIEIRGLTRRFGARTAVDNLTADIAAGTTFALLGLNGAGKTTTIRMLAGLLTPTAGDAFLDGHSVVHDTVRAKQVINLSPQETAVAPNLTVLENLEFIAGLYGMRRTQARDRARQMLERVGTAFEEGRDYTEKEVNAIIRERFAFSDVELIRRELFEAHMLGRLPDGSKYWKNKAE